MTTPRLWGPLCGLFLLARSGLSWAGPAPAMAADPRATAIAEDRPGGGHEHGGREARERLRRQVMEQMRALRMWKITEELKLDQGTAAKLFPILARFDDQDEQLGRERGETMHALHNALSQETPDSGVVQTLVDRFVDLRSRRSNLEVERITAIRRALTPIQQAKLLMLLPRIEDEFRQRIREVMSGHHHEGRMFESDTGDFPPRRSFPHPP